MKMSIYENIKGFVPSSLVDWDGKVVSVIFLSGCNFRCKFCSNKDLIINPGKLKTIDFKEIKKYLERNKDFVDGVVISGGEPSLYSGIEDLCRELKELGFLVKIDTNGSNPDMLKELLDKKLVDFVAMDIKTSFSKYKELTGWDDIDKIKKSIELTSKFPDYEFRITVFPGLNKEDLLEVARYLQENQANKALFLQQFRNDSCLDKEFEAKPAYKKEQLEEFSYLIKPFFEKSGIRNL